VIEVLLEWVLSPAGKAVGGLVLAGTVIGGAYELGRHSEKVALNARLADGRITILKDGKAIDEKVLSGDDDYLCSVIGGC
jgi:hypothetical protein